MEERRMSTAICHVILAGSSIWTCRSLYDAGNFHWAYGSLGLYVAKSCVGVVRYGPGGGGNKVTGIYDLLEMSSMSIGIPFIATDLFLHHGYSWGASVMHGALGIVPVFCVCIGSHENAILPSMGLILIGCSISTIVMGCVNSNFWAVGAVLWHMLVVGFKPNQQNAQVASVDMYTLGLCFFNFFVYRALTFNANNFQISCCD